MVLAGPGSGKTTVITHRVRHLIEMQKIPPTKILVITFTKAAALSMQRRFQAMEVLEGAGVTFGTFHAVFFAILRAAYHYTAADILREEERFRILTQLAMEGRIREENLRDVLPQLAGEISLVKTGRIAPECYYSTVCGAEDFRRIYRGYQQQLARLHKLDYDDMLTGTLSLLQERPDVLRQWQARFSYILIDEFQDINPLQYEIIRLLAAPENNLFVVGDDDQSIYAFRGAAPSIMLDFPKVWPDAKCYMLEENYRSVPEIVETAGRVIAANKKRYVKQIRAAAPEGMTKESRGEDTCVFLHSFPDVAEESLYLVREIRRARSEGTALQQMAVLCRTALAGRFLARKLDAFGIPVQQAGNVPGLYDHWIVKDVMAYLRLGLGGRDRRDFLQIMNRPVRYLSRDCLDTPQVSFDRLRMYYEEKHWMVERIDELEEALERIRLMKPFAAVNYIRFGIGYEDFLETYALEHRIDPEELKEVTGELQEEAKGFATFQEWSDHVDALRKKMHNAQQERRGSADSRRQEAVQVMTLHAAKGLEFDLVFLPDLSEGMLPYHRANLESDIEEERRLMYVGMTRARHCLHLTWTRKRFGREAGPSRFLLPLMEK